ncbi:MAG: sulfite exporter TauE/SafE family protein [Thermoleophilia bacterium]
MDYLFPASGVHTNILIPPLVAFLISSFTSMSGVSGAFLILPFQMSYLGFTSPSVSSTNFVFNIVSIPSGVYRYIRDGRMAWPLTMVVVTGTIPGVFVGYWLRVRFLPDPKTFKLFVGCVLLYVGGRLLLEMSGRASAAKGRSQALEAKFRQRSQEMKAQQSARLASGLPTEAVVKTVSVNLSRVTYEFWGEQFSFSTPGMFALALVVGVIGGTYGIGGGAIIAPFCVAVFRLPVYTVAGAALMGTFITSVAGVTFYSLVPLSNGASTAPDWRLGLLFGLGGFAGMYVGASFQKFVPQKILKLMLGAIIVFTALSYIVKFFTG